MTEALLMQRVNAQRLTDATATMGMLANSRVWRGAAAKRALECVQGYTGEFVGNDHIQLWSWDFVNNKPLKVTPLVFSFATKEAWTIEGAPHAFNSYNVLAVYDVGDAENYECRQFQGSSGDEFLASHTNSIVIDRAVGDEIANALMDMESTEWTQFSVMNKFWNTLGQFLASLLRRAQSPG